MIAIACGSTAPALGARGLARPAGPPAALARLQCRGTNGAAALAQQRRSGAGPACSGAARRACGRFRHVVVRASGASDAVSALTDELRLLETERDDAVKTAESCARTSVRLEEMLQLLDKLALEKMKDGDEDGARQVLQEKASTRDVLDRTNARAQVNYSLASKLAEKIGSVQARLVEMLAPAGGGGASAAAPAAADQPPAQQPQPARAAAGGYGAAASGYGGGYDASSSAAAGTAGYPQPAGGYGSSGGFAGGFSDSYTPRKPAWEESLEAARARIAEAEAAAAAEGRRAAWQARESIEEARDRLRRQAQESVAAAQARVRSRANESIAEARARIAAEDAAVLAKVQGLMARYRRGDYVTEDELEWAFRQLERRFVL